MKKSARKFELRPAKREAVGLLVGMVGPSGSGKTFSALRVATGMQRVTGGEIAVIDTERGRALNYADLFKFQHVPFDAPFGPLDYKAALEQTIEAGARIIVIDSASHEHEGEGGVLAMHEAELDRLAGDDQAKRDRVKFLAWVRPKRERQAFVNALIQCNRHVILCFRAKEKIDIKRGKDPQPLGWQVVGSEELAYEMVLQFLLKPGANGVPTWSSELEAERAVAKVPRQFVEWFEGKPEQIDEDLGEKLALWAKGDAKRAIPAPAPKRLSEVDELVEQYRTVADRRGLAALERRREKLWTRSTPRADKDRLKAAADAAKARVEANAIDWGVRFKRAATAAELDETWRECRAEHGGDVPLDLEALRNDRREAIEEREALKA